MSRQKIKSFLVISTSNKGDILNCNIKIPSKNVFVKPTKSTYNSSNKEAYKKLSQIVIKKVNMIIELKNRNKQLELLARKNAYKNVSNMFKTILSKTTSE